jgi:hypothetical protein
MGLFFIKMTWTFPTYHLLMIIMTMCIFQVDCSTLIHNQADAPHTVLPSCLTDLSAFTKVGCVIHTFLSTYGILSFQSKSDI